MACKKTYNLVAKYWESLELGRAGGPYCPKISKAYAIMRTAIEGYEREHNVQFRAVTPKLDVYTVEATNFTSAVNRLHANRIDRLLERWDAMLRHQRRMASCLMVDPLLRKNCLDPEHIRFGPHPEVTRLQRALRGEDPGNPEPTTFEPDFVSLDDADTWSAEYEYGYVGSARKPSAE